MKTKIIFATGNPNKLREIKEILGEEKYDILTMKQAGIDIDIVEDGKTFEDLQARRVNLTADTGRPKLIDRLPREFSRDQLRALIQEARVATPDRILISQWKANHWIEESDHFLYKKLI